MTKAKFQKAPPDRDRLSGIRRGGRPAPASVEEFRGRLAAARGMHAKRLTHLVVYGDREHFANLAYLTGFDPRFEEALLIVELSGKPLLVAGNECAGYLDVSPLYVAGTCATSASRPSRCWASPEKAAA